jgi:hypothetical protein
MAQEPPDSLFGPQDSTLRVLAKRLTQDFLAHPRRFFDPAPARWDDRVLMGVDFGGTPADPKQAVVVFTTAVTHTPIGFVQAGSAVITDAAVREALEANRRALEAVVEARLRAALEPDPFSPRRIYQPPEPLNPFSVGYWASRALQSVYQPAPAVLLPPYDPGPAFPTRHRAPAPRFAVGETVLYRGGTVTIERRFRMLWKWRYTIDGPALWLEVDEEELAPL